MSAKHSYTTAEYLPWDTAMMLIRKLYKDGNYRMSLLIGCGCFFGLRISDLLLSLTWDRILNTPSFHIVEKKTGKHREIKINPAFQEHIKDCHEAMGVTNDERPCFLNRYGSVISVQAVNKELKEIKIEYQLRVKNFSTHSLRKTWARQIFENENAAGRGQLALAKLSSIMNHSSESITRAYLGLKQQEIGEVYDSLSF